jgi:hypothetical protein
MRPPHDLMERLAAADPLRDTEALSPEQQREADALLERLIATPVEHEHVRRPRRRWVQLGVATACGAVVVFAALSLLDSDNSPAPHVLDKAIAALAQKDAIYHYEAIASGSSSEFPETAKTDFFFESWHTTTGLIHRKAWRLRNGRKSRRYDDFAGRRRPGRRGGPALRYDPFTNTIGESGFGSSPGGGGAPGFDPFDPSRSLRELQAEGRLRLRGRVEVDGKPAYRLVSGPVRAQANSVERTELLVDTETYLPRLQRYSVRYENGSTMRASWRYVTFERLPLNEETRPLLALDPHPGAKCSPFAEDVERRGPLGYPNPCSR